MSQFCTSCGKPITEGASFCTACGARQAGAAPPTPAPVSAAPGTPAPATGSPWIKIVAIVVAVIALITVAGVGSCVFIAYRLRHKAAQYRAAIKEAVPTNTYQSANGMPDLPDAMDKMGDAIRTPNSSFHLSFKKVDSDGTSYSLEEDVTPAGMTGQETQVYPKTAADPGSTKVFPRNATAGSHEYQMTATAIELAYLNPMNIRDAQSTVKLGAEEQAGGYDARRYDFDLSRAPASEKAGTLLAGKWLGGVVNNATGGHVAMKDYNVKGSAWLAKGDGRMVKFNYDDITTFTDGSQKSTHYEGTVTKK